MAARSQSSSRQVARCQAPQRKIILRVSRKSFILCSLFSKLFSSKFAD